MKGYTIVGGAGFIGSHFADTLLNRGDTVTVYDNLSSGRLWHFEQHLANPSFKFVHAEVLEIDQLANAMQGSDVVIHLASNPDIARAVSEPRIDFDQGTALTNAVVEAMRVADVKSILYASGSGVYGDKGDLEFMEDFGPMIPISTYGASKLAGETLIASYAYMFSMKGSAFRFGNVVGPRQTHGVGYDFARRLIKDPSRLEILGDGMQSKSYIHVSDVVNAVLTAADSQVDFFDVFNVATGDYITVREIADLAIAAVGIEKGKTQLFFTGGNRGWKGDVPVIRLNTEKIRKLGWTNKMNCAQAVRSSLDSLISDRRVMGS